jgi:hypothetical protein
MLNEKMKKLTVIDVSLVKLSVFFATLVIVKFFPQLLRIDTGLLILLVVACGARPFYTVWIKK